MTVNFLGLAGCLGALDIPSTELVMRRTSNGDNALRDFLDIFNHRLGFSAVSHSQAPSRWSCVY